MEQHHTDNRGFKSRVILGEYRTPRMVVWLMKHFPEFIKNERQGGRVLFVLAIVIFLAAAGVFWSVAGGGIAQRYSSRNKRHIRRENQRNLNFSITFSINTTSFLYANNILTTCSEFY